MQAQQLRTLKFSVLFYAHQDSKSVELAKWAEMRLGIHPVDLLSHEAGPLLYHLTGMRQAASPTLVIKQSAGIEIASGELAAEQALRPAMEQAAPVLLAKRALLVMSGLIISAFIFATEVHELVSLLPILGFISVSLMWGHCLHCSSNNAMLIVFAPLLALSYLAVGILLFTAPISHKRACYWGFLLISGLIPCIQAYLLTLEPKFCPACLIITFLSAAYFVATLRTLATSELSGIATPQWAKTIMVIVLGLLAIRHSLILGGWITVAKPIEIKVANLVGTPFTQSVPALSLPQPGVLYVVTEEMCGACQAAEYNLNRMSITWKKIPVCNFTSGSECFSNRSSSFVTPMFLICDHQGRITFQRNGWVASSQELTSFKTQILRIQRRLYTTK